MFETLGDHPEGQRLHMSNGLIPSSAVAKDAGQVSNLGDPTAIVFTVELDREGQAHGMYSNTAGALPNELRLFVARSRDKESG